MLETKKVQKKKNMFEKQVEYREPVRLNSKAKTKEAITSKYSESYQLNVIADTVIKIADKIGADCEELREMKRYIDETRK